MKNTLIKILKVLALVAVCAASFYGGRLATRWFWKKTLKNEHPMIESDYSGYALKRSNLLFESNFFLGYTNTTNDAIALGTTTTGMYLREGTNQVFYVDIPHAGVIWKVMANNRLNAITAIKALVWTEEEWASSLVPTTVPVIDLTTNTVSQ